MANYGVNVSYKSSESRDIPIQSTTVIGIVSTDKNNIEVGVYHSPKLKDAIQLIKDEQKNDENKKKVDESNLVNVIADIARQKVECPVIIAVGGTLTEGTTKLAEYSKNITRKPSIIIGAAHISTSTHTQEAMEQFSDLAENLSAIAIVDVKPDPKKDIDTAIENITNIKKSKHLFLVHDSNVQVERPTAGEEPSIERGFVSALVAGLFANLYTKENGWALSPSMRAINGIKSGGVEFVMGGACEANKLRYAKINSIIAADGFRLWGDKTNPDADWSTFDDVRKVRIFETIAQSTTKGLFFAVDRNALDKLPYVKDAVENLCSRLQVFKIILGFEVTWDEEKNTKESVNRGEFYLNIDIQIVPTVKQLKVTFNSTEQYSPILFELIKK